MSILATLSLLRFLDDSFLTNYFLISKTRSQCTENFTDA